MKTENFSRAAMLLLLCMFTAVGAGANSLVDYNFDTGEDQSKWITLTDNATQLIGSEQDNAASSLTDIGFSFPFGDGTYTQFWVNSNGILSFSSTPANSSSPQFDSSDISANQPKICGISKDLSTGYYGYVKYELTGTSPNRILVCEFYTYHNNANDGSAIYRWQVQLHEAGAKVVIIYDYFNTSSHSWSMRDYQIGLSQSNSDIWTVNPQTHVATHATEAVSEKYSARPGNYRYYEFTPIPTFTVSDDGNTYTIHNATGWDVFCDALQDNDTYNRFSNKTVKLDADITVSRAAGSDQHDFCGTFDGQGNTLTFTSTENDDRVAPFSYISNVGSFAAIIRRLNVVANITTNGQRASALVGEAWGKLTIEHCTVSGTITTSKQFAGGIIGSVSNSPLNITDCRSSVTISSSIEGDGTHGGLAGRVPSEATLNISGCVFDGKIVTTNGTTNCGGLVGHSENGAGTNVSIANSLYAPARLESNETEVGTSDDDSYTFARNVIAEKITNCYYTRTLGTAQGKAPHTVTGGEGVPVSNIALTGTTTSYAASGITAYSGGGITRTVGQATTFYYGSGDQVTLTLGHADRTGYTFSGYAASNGSTLSGTENPYTLTMPDANVTINAQWTPNTYTVSFNANGGTGTMSDQTFTYDVPQLLTANAFTRTGYNFIGWATSANGAVAYTDQQSVSNLTTGGTVMLYAQWSIPYIGLDGQEATHDAVVINADNMPTSLSGWYVVQGTVDYTTQITLTGDTHIILADGSAMTVASGSTSGILYNSACSFYVYGQSGQSGRLNVTSQNYAIRIDGGDITIAGGNVIAEGWSGIFAQKSNNRGGNVTIKNATVTATGTENVGAIYAYGGNITIDNSDVTATNTDYHAIYAYSGGSIFINGGKTTATGDWAIYSNEGDVTITGGQVSAIGSYYGIQAAGNITLGWTNATDYIYATKMRTTGSSVTEGQTFFDEDFNTYTGTLTSDQISVIWGKTLRPLDGYLVTMPDDVTISATREVEGTTVSVEPLTIGTTPYYIYKEGDQVSLTVAVDEAEILTGVSYSDGTTDTPLTATNGVYSFTMPAHNITIAVTKLINHWGDDFEGDACRWTLINGNLTNAWAWGTATNNGGTHALYISNNGGTTNAYTNTAFTTVYAAKRFHFEADLYDFSYDWKANGENRGDYLRVALVPASTTLTASDYAPFGPTTLPEGWIALDGGSQLNQNDSWQTQTASITLSEAGDYYLVFAWFNNGGRGDNPPAAIDNVSFTRFGCMEEVTGLTASEVASIEATLAWTAGSATQWQVDYSTSADFQQATTVTVDAATCTLTGLLPGTSYYVRVRTYCGDYDYGRWSTTTFTTLTNVAYLDADGHEATATGVYVLNGSEETLGTDGQETWYVAEGNVSFDHQLEASGDVHIILKDNAVMNIGTAQSPVSGNGIYGNGHSISIYAQSKGDNKGQLLVNARVYGIFAQGGNVGIYGGNVTATATATDSGSKGIFAMKSGSNGGSITLKNATVTAEGACAIQAQNGNLTAEDCTITATATSSNYYSIWSANSNTTLTNCEVTATGGSMGIFAEGGNVEISGGEVEATGTQYGIFAKNNGSNGGSVSITNHATVTAKGACAIQALNGDLTAEDCTITATATSSNNYSIWSTNSNTTLTNCEVTATGGSMGIYAEGGHVEISGGEVEATGTQYGIFAKNNGSNGGSVSITNHATVTAEGGDFGIDAQGGSLTAEDCTITATATTGYGTRSTGGNTTLTNCKVTATGGSAGIYTDSSRNIVINGGEVEAYNTNLTTGYGGIAAWYGSVSVTGATITAGGIFSVFATNDMVFDGSTVTASNVCYTPSGDLIIRNHSKVTSTASEPFSLKNEGGSISISDSEVDAIRVIYGKGGVTLTNATVNVDYNANSDAIYAVNNGLTIDGSTVTTTGHIYSERCDLSISNSEVKATGSIYNNPNTDHYDLSISNSEVEFTDQIFTGGNLTIDGSIVKATGNGSGSIVSVYGILTLGWSSPSDLIYAKYYYTNDGSIVIAEGKTFIDEDGNSYSGTMDAYTINGKTLRPYSSNSDVSGSLLVLADDAANTAIINTFNGKTYNVTLAGRTLYKDGDWNTLCLPFDVSITSGTLSGDNVVAMTLNSTASNLNDGTLTLNFDAVATTGEQAGLIPAGTPFIIKWASKESPATNLVNPVFSGMTIDNSAEAIARKTVAFEYVSFVGTYNPVIIPSGGDNTKLYLGANNTLYWPNGAMTIGAFRAYFQLTEDAQTLSRFVLNFGDEEVQGIKEIDDLPIYDLRFEAGAWYTIDGVKLDGKPTKKGLYIHGGKKVVIK